MLVLRSEIFIQKRSIFAVHDEPVKVTVHGCVVTVWDWTRHSVQAEHVVHTVETSQICICCWLVQMLKVMISS